MVVGGGKEGPRNTSTDKGGEGGDTRELEVYPSGQKGGKKKGEDGISQLSLPQGKKGGEKEVR